MTFTITIGWWAVPLAFTMLMVIWSAFNSPVYRKSFGDVEMGFLIMAAAIIASLVAWFIWAALT